MAEIKDILKKLRSEKNMSQAALAEELHAGLSTVASWEVGKRFPSRENMEQLADLFNVDLAYLYGETNIRQRVHFDKDGNPMIADVPDFEPDHLELIDLYSKLTKEQKESVMTLLRSFAKTDQ